MKTVYLDIETTGLNPDKDELLCVAYMVDGQTYIKEEVDYELRKLLLDNLVVGANLSFDLKWLLRFSTTVTNVYDVVIVNRVLTAGKYADNSLAGIAKERLGVTIDKSYRKKILEGSYDKEGLYAYVTKDLAYLADIVECQKKEIEENNLQTIIDLENNLVPVVADMEYIGIPFNVRKWLSIKSRYETRARELHEKICKVYRKGTLQTDLFGNESYSKCINLNSDQQVKQLLLENGIKVKDTKRETLKEFNTDLVNTIIEYRECSHAYTTYGENWLKFLSYGNRIHSNFNQVEARSGRFSSSNPNLQNVPTGEHEECFEAEDPYVLVSGDYSQIELRIVADFSNDKNMIDILNKGGDIHAQTASLVLGLPIEECGKDSVARRIGKTLNFSIIYGIGKDKLAKDLGVTEQEAGQYISKYFERFPDIKKYLDSFTSGVVKTHWGRIRWIPPSETNSARNHPIQGTAADMLKHAMINVHRRIKEYYNSHIVNVIHDEIIIECRDNCEEAIAKILKEEMENSGKLILTKVPVVVDV